jgi:hypothetical protein
MQQTPVTGEAGAAKDAEKETFSASAQNELDELKVVISGLRTKADSANAQTKARLHEEVEKVETSLRETQQRLTELKASTTDKWKQLKETFAQSLERLKGRIADFRKSAA